MKQYRAENRERIKRLQSEYYEKNKEKLLDSFRSYYLKNREEIRKRGKLHYENNKALYLAYSRTRKATLIKRTPSWLTQDEYDQISSIYKQCREISDSVGVIHHVDHIVPLNGSNVCGLHVPWNLQITPAEINLKKSNRHDVSTC